MFARSIQMMQGAAFRCNTPLMKPMMMQQMMRKTTALTPLQAAAANFSTLVKPKNYRPMQIDSFKVDENSFAIDIRLN